MTTRRNFIKGGATLASVPLLGAFPTSVAAANPGDVPMIAKYFHDPSLVAGQRFAHTLERRGIRSIGATGDWTPVWLRELDPVWRKEATAIAGVSSHGPMFMLENIANRHGMRLVYSASLIERTGACGISVQGKPSIVERCSTTARTSEGWAEQVADAFLGLTGLEVGRAAPVSSTSGKPATPMEDAVYAWVIAPVKGTARYI